MARAVWSGAIAFGLVRVPVRLVPAIERKNIRFHLLSPDGKHRLRRTLYCEETGEEIDSTQAMRGYEIAPGQHVLVTSEELEQLKPQSSRTIDVAAFVDLEEIDPIYFNRPYALAPEGDDVKAYRLLADCLAQTGKAAIARFVMYDREYLAAIRAVEGVLCLETMYFSDEVGDMRELAGAAGGVADAGAGAPQERELAMRLIEAMSKEFDPAAHPQEHRERILELIDRKAAGGGDAVAIAEEQAEPEAAALDLADALKESLARTGAAADTRGEPTRRRRTA